MSFVHALRRLAGPPAQPEPAAARARVLAIAAQKGGVGKTTTAVNLAVAAARFRGLRTLLVDLDGQGHVEAALAAQIEGANPSDRGGASVSDILLGNQRDLLEIVRSTRISDLFVVPSDKGLATTEGILAGRIGKEFLLRAALRRARERFDLIVLDCPPNLGNLTLNALVAADACLVPCDMSILSMSGVMDLCSVLETIRDRLGHPIALLGVVPTRVDRRNRRVTDAVLEQLSDLYGDQVFRTHVPVSSALSRAQMDGLNVFDYDARSAGAKAYRALVDEVAERLAVCVQGN